MAKKKTPQIILIDKPKGVTSFAVIRQLRKKSKIKKIGHAGTLDPLATGLLIIGLGKGTKRLSSLLKLPKVYQVSVLLGMKTTTGDLEGKIIEKKPVSDLDIKRVKKVLSQMTGKLTLAVPLYSAVKIKGVPLYKLARKGKKITPPQKEMEIFWIKLKSHHPEENGWILELELKVKSGTYIRSVAEEIGHRLGYPATVKSLRRTKVGSFDVKEASLINHPPR